jgi:hypothetical protein
MDRIRQTARALCCWGAAARPAASPNPSAGRGSSTQGSSLEHGSSTQSLSSAGAGALSSSTASGHARRQQLVENLSPVSLTASTDALVLATAAQPTPLVAIRAGEGEADLARADTSGTRVSGENLLPISSEREVASASIPEIIGHGTTSGSGFAALSPLSPDGTLWSNVGPQLQSDTHESTPSSLVYSEFSATSSSSNDLSRRLQGMRFIEDPTALGTRSIRPLPISQRSAFTPLNRRDNRVGHFVEGAEWPGSAAADAPRRRTAPASQSRVVTWENLFEDIPEATAVATRPTIQEPVNPRANPPVVNLLQDAGGAPVLAAVVARPSAGSGAMEQEEAASLPFMPLLPGRDSDNDRAVRPLPMLQRRSVPAGQATTDFLGFREAQWPSLPVPPASLRRSNSGASSSSTDSNA